MEKKKSGKIYKNSVAELRGHTRDYTCMAHDRRYGASKILIADEELGTENNNNNNNNNNSRLQLKFASLNNNKSSYNNNNNNNNNKV
nr:hypothetical protein BaRGS_021751 [Batillaria attramentaria]